MNLSQTKIETERLLLVPVSRKYSEQIISEYRDPTMLYMNFPPPESLEILNERMKEREKEIEEGKVLFVAVLLKATKEFLGCFSLNDLDQKTPEMGGWLKKSAHGKRYGQEAAAAIKRWADDHLNYEHLLWPCVSENVSSRKVAEALGGKVGREFEKTAATGRTWAYVEYWIPKCGTGVGRERDKEG